MKSAIKAYQKYVYDMYSHINLPRVKQIYIKTSHHIDFLNPQKIFVNSQIKPNYT